MEFVNYETVQLQKLRFGIEQHIAKDLVHLIDQIDLERTLGDNLSLQLRGYVWAQEPHHRYETRYPADWWQAVKERWFPKWALDRWPVTYTRFIVDARIIYPELKIALPEHEHRLVLNKLVDSTDWLDYKDKEQ